MKFLNYLILTIVVLLTLNSCSKNTYKFELNTSKKVAFGQEASVNFKQIEGNSPDSIHLYIGKKRLSVSNNSSKINTTDLGVGKHIITALAFYPNKVKKVINSIEVVADKKPTLYTYKIINEFPHDKEAFTQGLEFYDGFLYETTGQHGKSWLRKTDYKTGKVIQQKKLNEKYFGEGMTIFNNKIFWLTWQAKKGFIYNLTDFEQTGEFKYHNSLQGWGLTHNKTELIKSDGTNKIWFLNPENLKETRSIQAYTDKLSLKDLNELEWIDGKIYANYWKKPFIAIINPKNGIVEGIINLKGLVAEMKKTQNLEANDDVLNGIAYDKENKRLFVTGKHWEKLFEIEIVKQ